MKQSRRDLLAIGFFDTNYKGMSFLHSDALVVTLIVVNHNIHRILVDNKSSVDIMQ
jgi:hypothetical protein